MNEQAGETNVPVRLGETAGGLVTNRTADFAAGDNGELNGLLAAWQPDASRLRLSVVVVHYNDPEHLLMCVDTLLHDQRIDEIVVVDNGSEPDGIKAVTANCDGVKIVCSPINLGFGGGANLGAAHATGDLIVFLNPDTVPDTGCMTALALALSKNGGVVGPQVRTGSDGLQEYGCTIDRMLLPRAMSEPGDPLYVCGCCLATTRLCFDTIGGFDERYFLFQEDVEFCWQAQRRGFSVIVVPGAGLVHAGGAAAGGGYRRSGRIETSSRRILLRERNGWAVILACAPSRRIPQLVALSILRTLVFTGILVFYSRPRDALRLWFEGLVWNVVGLRSVLKRRRRPGVIHEGEQRAWRCVEKRLYIWDLACKGERLRFVDTETVAKEL
ncbi:MAG: glycosyltransferase family 2 protein [Ferrimicrobium sp.]